MNENETSTQASQSSERVLPASNMRQREVDARWCCWVPFPLEHVDVHDVVVAVLKSGHIAQMNLKSAHSEQRVAD